jgi:hypothetical protein
MSHPVQEKVVDAITAVPFLSLFGYNFITLNEFLETATLIIGLVSGLFALFFNVRRWWRERKHPQ